MPLWGEVLSLGGNGGPSPGPIPSLIACPVQSIKMESVSPQLTHGQSDGWFRVWGLWELLVWGTPPRWGHWRICCSLCSQLCRLHHTGHIFYVLIFGCHWVWECLVLGEGRHICPGGKCHVSGRRISLLFSCFTMSQPLHSPTLHILQLIKDYNLTIPTLIKQVLMSTQDTNA
jgi:hypothetical protein